MNRIIKSCGRHISWIAIAAALVLIPLGGLLSATVVGIIIGGPLLLVALALLRNSVTPQPCV
jgi:hypothetical protein